MAAFAGYRNLPDYIETNCRRRELSERSLAEALDRSHSWLNAIKKGRYKLSPKAADELAAFFGDNPKIVRVLADIDPIPEQDPPIVISIKEIAASLPRQGQKEYLDYGRYLRQKYATETT